MTKCEFMYIVITSALLLLLLTGCTSKVPSNDITITAVEHTDNRIISMKLAGSDIPLLFDVQHDENIKQVYLWLDYYEYGQYVKSFDSMYNFLDEEVGNISLAMSATEIKDTLHSLTLSIQQNQSFSSYETELNFQSRSKGHMYIPEIKTTINEEVSLGYILMNETKNGVDMTSNDQLNLEQNDYVYILKAKFSNE